MTSLRQVFVIVVFSAVVAARRVAACLGSLLCCAAMRPKALQQQAQQQQLYGRGRLPHIRQKASWDCGLSCCVMALHAFSSHNAPPSSCSGALYALHAKLHGAKDVWTIDLCHLLHATNQPVAFYTSSLQVSPLHRHNSFYTRCGRDLAAEASRVRRLVAALEASRDHSDASPCILREVSGHDWKLSHCDQQVPPP